MQLANHCKLAQPSSHFQHPDLAGIKERVVVMMASKARPVSTETHSSPQPLMFLKVCLPRIVSAVELQDGVLAQGVAAVLECIQDDPHLHELLALKESR